MRTHRQVLFHELAQRGRVTYRELLEKYESRGYTYYGFILAVHRAAKCGEVVAPERKGAPIRANCCPCCGRAYE